MRTETQRHLRSMGFVAGCLLVLGQTQAIAQAPYQAPYLVKNINALTDVPTAPYAPTDLVAVGNLLLFKGCDAYHGCELWKSDGTEAGTVIVKDIMPGSGSGASPDGYYSTRSTAVNGTLFFVGSDGLQVPALWKSDGTEAGTVMVKQVSSSGGNVIEDLTNVNGLIFFTAVDYGASDVHGRELWKSDGTEAGTTLVADITPGQWGGGPRDLTSVNGTLFFSADDTVHGRELWKSDGTPGGTRMVKDIYPGAGESSTWQLAAVNGTLFRGH